MTMGMMGRVGVMLGLVASLLSGGTGCSYRARGYVSVSEPPPPPPTTVTLDATLTAENTSQGTVDAASTASASSAPVVSASMSATLAWDMYLSCVHDAARARPMARPVELNCGPPPPFSHPQ